MDSGDWESGIRARIEPGGALSQSLAPLKSKCGHDTKNAVERFANSPLFDSEGIRALCYQVACHLIASQSAMIESRSFIGHEPDKDSELPDRIEWLADRLWQASAARDTVWSTELPLPLGSVVTPAQKSHCRADR